VIGPDLGRFAQARPGSQVRFATTTFEAAVAARRAEAAIFASPIETTPLVRKELSAELLLGSNLISGVTGDEAT
jgi:hypothetical protein